jgi:hypothetical protein
MLKLLISVGLLAAAGLVIITFGIGLPAIALSVSGLASLLWCCTRSPRPKEELTCASVSCCHYLGDHEDEHTHKPQWGTFNEKSKPELRD